MFLIPEDVLDFEWACSATLKYFSMDTCKTVSDKRMHVIASRLAAMPELRKVKFQRITITMEIQAKSLGSKLFSSLFSSSASVSSTS